jgi:gluconokinase
MPLDLLDSQFATLEPPAPEERVLSVPVTQTPAEVVGAIVERLRLEPAGRRA